MMSTDVHDTFVSMKLRFNLMVGLTQSGMFMPQGIQKRGVVPFCQGLDVFEQAEPDMKRTVTFCLGILQQLDYDLHECQALILTPNLESVEEITMSLRRLGHSLGVRVYDLVEEDQQIGHVVVGTPATVLTMLETNVLCPKHVKIFVLDEADVMSLYSCVNYQISKIFKILPVRLQVAFFLEKDTPEVREMVGNLTTKTFEIVDKINRLPLEEIPHSFIACDDEDESKMETLLLLLPVSGSTHNVVFVNTETSLEMVARKIRQAGHKVFIYKKSKHELTQFCSAAFGVLLSMKTPPQKFVGSNTVVINYDTPCSPKKYIRQEFGNVQKVISFLTRYDWSVMLVSRRLYKFRLFTIDISSLQFETSSVLEGSRLETKEADSGVTHWLSYDEVYESFSDMNLKKELLFSISNYGFAKPTEIQQRAIMALCKKLNVFVESESGPEQIAAFCCAILQSYNENLQKCQCIVLATNVDRVEEIARILRRLGEHLSFQVYACGVSDIDSDDPRYHNNNFFHVVVGTPVRVLNMLKNKLIVPTHINLIILDQADITAKYSSKLNQIASIPGYLPSGVQVGVFSETTSVPALEATRSLCGNKEVVKIVVPRKNEGVSSSVELEGMMHFVINDKSRELLDLFLGKLDSATECIIFVDNKYSADRLNFVIEKNAKLKARTICSDMDQSCREVVMREFEVGSVNVVITTLKLAFYGLHNIRASLIINHDTTPDMESYMERISRFGKRGGLVINHVVDDTWWNVVSLYDQFVSRYDESGVYFQELLPTSFDHVCHMIST